MKIEWVCLVGDSDSDHDTHAANIPGGVLIESVRYTDGKPRTATMIFIPGVRVSDDEDELEWSAP